jgi:hypothetical protein
MEGRVWQKLKNVPGGVDDYIRRFLPLIVESARGVSFKRDKE